MQAGIIKIITKEKFLKALENKNYKEVSPEAQKVIEGANIYDMLELNTQFGSALKVISARKIDEITFWETLKGN